VPVCRQLRDQVPPADLTTGARQFAVCYECRQPVSRPWADAYKRRWTLARERATLSQRVPIRVNREQWHWFKQFAATKDLTPSELLERWMDRAVERWMLRGGDERLTPATRKGSKRR
jgi:hypothetical protein